MDCPDCHASETRTTVTEHRRDEQGNKYTKRFCRCLNCGARFRTIERYERVKPGPKVGSTRMGGEHMQGEKNHASVMTDQNIREIRALVAAGRKQKDVAAQYGISANRVSLIVRRLAWKHVT